MLTSGCPTPIDGRSSMLGSGQPSTTTLIYGKCWHSFGASNLDLRTGANAFRGQCILYESLSEDQNENVLATTVALFLRMIDPDLCRRFAAGEASVFYVADPVFD